ncbi:MAG TPA: arylesterase [Eoetvoesiella sp.]
MRTHWRWIAAALCCFHWLSAQAQSAAGANETNRSILVIGDSLSAEYGISRGSGWVSIVAQKLNTEQRDYQIENASISGDTTSGGVNRLAAALLRTSPTIVIIELGSNDALRGLSLAMTQQNLATMIKQSQQAGADVLLVGMQIPPNYGRAYAEQFKQIFVTLAQQYNTELVPFLLDGIATDPKQFQADGIHPNEQAQITLAKNVWTHLGPMLKP